MANNAARMSIGVLAKQAGVGVETIRFYQRRGLLEAPNRPPGGIRRYSDKDLSRLRFIKSAQRLGFSLDEILQLLRLDDGAQCEAVSRIAADHLDDIRDRLNTLHRMENVLSALVNRCQATAEKDAVRCPLIDALHERI